MKIQIFTALSFSIFSHFSFAANLVIDGSFESTGLTNTSPFSPYPTFNGSWTAVNTDGDFFTSPGTASNGVAYADLLTNPGNLNPRTYWNETSNIFGPYDRIATLVNVLPNTTYLLNFDHSSQQSRFLYPGDRTLLQIQSLNTGYALDQLFTTPTTNAWVTRDYTFTTDATTSQIAVLFSSFGPNQNSMSLDNVIIDVASVPETTSSVLFAISSLVLFRRRRA
jgi:hypothetical protein